MGILLDMIGRRVLISLQIFIIGLTLGYIPFASPIELLYLNIIMCEMFTATLEASPLAVDYAPVSE